MQVILDSNEKPSRNKAIEPKERSEAEPHGASITYFTIGSSKKNVLEVQGQPSSYHENWWMYGFSTVNFSKDGKVSSYSNIGNNLKVKVIPDSNEKLPREKAIEIKKIAEGMAKEEVENILGKPDSIIGNTWRYSSSWVTFTKDGIIKKYHDAGNLNMNRR
jgi:outer membrane protein assembly factor BamE (lipoprotein component of BamABCDE complex)